MTKKNHTSEKSFPEDIKAYLDEEINYAAILGHFPRCPVDNLQISPMMTRDKPNALHHRVIILDSIQYAL